MNTRTNNLAYRANGGRILIQEAFVGASRLAVLGHGALWLTTSAPSQGDNAPPTAAFSPVPLVPD